MGQPPEDLVSSSGSSQTLHNPTTACLGDSILPKVSSTRHLSQVAGDKN